MKFYAGIGSRETPCDVLAVMAAWAQRLDALGWTLRSGGATGADTAFASGVTRKPEIYIPWPGFGGFPGKDGIVCGDDLTLARIAMVHHPAWERCSNGARKLHTRNVAQVLGIGDAPKSKFILCWTKGGKGEGGTGQALRIAKAFGVQVFDLALPNAANLLADKLALGDFE